MNKPDIKLQLTDIYDQLIADACLLECVVYLIERNYSDKSSADFDKIIYLVDLYREQLSKRLLSMSITLDS